jgi:predicted nucleic-acid-binding protein
VRAVDTSILVRALVQDDELQARLAEKAIEAGAWCSHLVLMELAWVLESFYRWQRDDVLDGLDACLAMPGLVVDEPAAVRAAVAQCRAHGAISVARALILAHAAARGHGPLQTFDGDLAKVSGAELLGSKPGPAPRRRKT